VIGVYDSGYGGLTVLRHVRRALPRHDLVYLGDSGRAPYGGRDVHTLLDFAEQCVERLFEEGCEVVVVACHTISCVALRHLQRRYGPPRGHKHVLGVTIPGAELAVRVSRGHVGILATARTVASGTYITEVHKLDPALQVSQQAAPLLAPIVEEGWERTGIAREAVQRYLAALGPVDTVLLGCTHYPLLDAVLREVLPEGVEVIDPGPYVAERLVDWLARHPGVVAPGDGRLRVLCSGDPVAFATHGERFLGEPLPEVQHVAEVDGRLAHADPTAAPRGQVERA
jgi:glutamate racemase